MTRCSAPARTARPRLLAYLVNNCYFATGNPLPCRSRRSSRRRCRWLSCAWLGSPDSCTWPSQISCFWGTRRQRGACWGWRRGGLGAFRRLLWVSLGTTLIWYSHNSLPSLTPRSSRNTRGSPAWTSPRCSSCPPISKSQVCVLSLQSSHPSYNISHDLASAHY